MLSRRQFLTHSCALGSAAVTATGALGHLGLSRHAAAQVASGPGDYRALVCVLLAGGNDSYNMVVPYDPAAYLGYAAMRSDLALPRASLLPLAQTDDEGRALAVHPGMPELRTLVDNGDAVLAANIGTLLEPFTPASTTRPLGLFSHLDQINQWQTAIMDDRS
ncbi:MAG: twin-arginine translocation signal domain-containing protein, partial [Pseudomonadota bacterium]